MYSMPDMTQVFEAEIELAVVSVVLKLEYKLQTCPGPVLLGLSLAFSNPQLVVLLCFILSFTHLLPPPIFFLLFTNEKMGAHVTDISKLRSLSIPSQQAL